MKKAIVTMESISPYQQGKYHKAAKLEKETADDCEKRTWRERCHTTKDGFIFIPPMQFKKSLEEAAAFLSISIPGRGKSKYTKHFLAGILVTEGLILPNKKENVDGVWVFGNSQGRRGAPGSRVEKCFPTIQEWQGEITYYILDETITEEIFTKVAKEAGNFIGIGVFRPANGGYHGRFVIKKVQWMDA